MMMYPYMKLPDETIITHSQILKGNKVQVHFERPTDDGFDSVRFELPSYEKSVWEGEFTEEEMQRFLKILHANAHLIYKYAASGGVNLA